jgi:hypothetical protein
MRREPSARLATKGESQGRQHLFAPQRASAVRGNQRGQRLGESLTWTGGLVTKESAGLEINVNGHPTPGQVGEGAAIAAVDPCRERAATRAQHRGPAGG